MSESVGKDQYIRGTVSNEEERAFKPLMLMQPDGTLRAFALQVYQDAAGAYRVALIEDDGTPRQQVVLWDFAGGAPIRAAGEPVSGQAQVSLYGWNGAALTQVMMEATGEVRAAPVGIDEAGNLDNFRTDPDRIPWQRTFDPWVEVPSVEIPVAEGDLWDPTLANAIRYAVEFNVVNNDAGGAAIAGVYVGREINSAGGLAVPYYWMFNETIPHPGESGWCGPFYMHGNDAIRGVAGVANDASVQWRVKRVDVGA